MFEDLDYYILDNLPPALMSSALKVCRRGGHDRVAFVIDARSGALFAEANAALDELAAAGDRPHLLFFDASDEGPVGCSSLSTRSGGCWWTSVRGPTKSWTRPTSR